MGLFRDVEADELLVLLDERGCHLAIAEVVRQMVNFIVEHVRKTPEEHQW